MKGAYTFLGLAFLLVFGAAYVLFSQRAEAPTQPALRDEIITNPTSTPMTDQSLTLTSSAFQSGGSIPSRFTCDGENVNPPLSISGVPEGARSLALLVDDPDIPEEVKGSLGKDVFDHWVLFNISPETVAIGEGQVPEGAIEGANGSGESAYTGACPPKQFEPKEHRYFFKLYALDVMLDLPEGAQKDAVEQAMEGHILGQAELMGRYERP